MRIGINGFGRTGRQFLRAVQDYHHDQLEVVAFNARADTKTYAHLFKYDSNFGIYPGSVEATKDSIIIDGKPILLIQESKPARIPWSDYGVEIVIEATGRFTAAEEAAQHINGSVKKVVISAPSERSDITVILGVNEGQYDPARHHIISNGSCTTNCLAPMIKVLQQNFGIKKGLMTTVHSVTNGQVVLDQTHEDLRRARSSGTNIIPTTTGAAGTIIEVIPELKGKLHGIAIRVPTPTVSLVDLVADLNKETTAEEVNKAFQKAANGELKGILEYCTEPLVSMDFKGNPASAIFDALSTMVIGGNMVKVLAWYDNEWGYSCRLADLVAYIATKGL
jgi:glyceraldehyde-3-phosphate dehydrogenase (EC 1.2.1.12)